MKIRNILLIKAKLCVVTFAAYHVIFVAVVLLPDLGCRSNVTDDPGILSALNSDADFSGVGNVNRVTEGASDHGASQYVDAIENILLGKFTPLDQVRSPGEEFINLGFILINLEPGPEQLGQQTQRSVRYTLFTLLQHLRAAPLHLLVVTDGRSVGGVAQLLAGTIAREAGLRAVTTRAGRWRAAASLPRVRVTFVSAADIAATNKPFVARLQSVTLQRGQNRTQQQDKYAAELFYLGPLYHLAFPALDSLIVIDITDLEFLASVELLQAELGRVRGGALVGAGRDLSPWYWGWLTAYRAARPGTRLGSPGRGQGLNTGVVLYQLAAMRRSRLYNSYLAPAMVTRLQEQYMFSYTLGDQVGSRSVDTNLATRLLCRTGSAASPSATRSCSTSCRAGSTGRPRCSCCRATPRPCSRLTTAASPPARSWCCTATGAGPRRPRAGWSWPPTPAPTGDTTHTTRPTWQQRSAWCSKL